MKLKISFIENSIDICDDKVNIIEVQNKNYFYRVVNYFNELYNGNNIDEIRMYENNNEINLINKINLIIDYFNIDLNTRKNLSLIYSLIKENIDEYTNEKINKINKDINKIFNKIILNIDIPIEINNEYNLENYVKLISPIIKKRNSILDNLMLIIDMEKNLNLNRIIIFVNLKQYLSDSEIVELYKYSIYNNIHIILIESNKNGLIKKYEKKLIIDDDLVEYVI